MKSEVRFTGQNKKLHIIIGVFATIIILSLALIFRFEFSLIFLSVAGSIVMIGAVTTLSLGANKWLEIRYRVQVQEFDLDERRQRIRKLTYEADKAEFEAHIVSFPKSHRVLIPNGSPVQVIEVRPDGSAAPLLSGPEPGQDFDLLSILTQAGQAYACLGGQQTGKTFQFRHIAAYWLRQGIQPWVIGPKWDQGEWQGCRLIGGQWDYDQVERGIYLVRQGARKRHVSDQPHKSHPIWPVFFDDWTMIPEFVESATDLIFEATTVYASVNIVLYFIIHSDTTDAWGVGRKGAALKDNFVKLFIEPHREASGRVVYSRSRGYIQFPGDRERVSVDLFRDEPGGAEVVLEGDQYINDDPQPSPTEAHILRLYSDGDSVSAIAEEVFGYKGGNQNDKVKAILSRWGVVV
jgi:hypothetical protein